MKYLYRLDRNFHREKYAQEVAGMTLAEKEHHLFQKYLEEIPVYLKEDDLFAGWYGYVDAWPREVADYMEKVQKTNKVAAEKRERERGVRYVMDHDYGQNADGYDRGHILIDLAGIIKRGLNGYIADIDAALSKAVSGSEEEQYLQTMKKSLAASEIFAVRYADLAAQMADNTEEPEKKERFLRIERNCRKVPMNPAEDFYEALQSLYFAWTLSCIDDDSWVSMSMGSFDQYMYPYYLKSREQGVTDEEIKAMIVQLFRMLDVYCDYDCAISVGGVDAEGNDATNELSYLQLAAEKTTLLRSPLFSVRINKNTPPDLLEEAVCSELFQIGQPTFYGEESCKAAILRRGIEEPEASRYQVSTCMQVVIAGTTVNYGWGIRTNMHLPLELAVNGGKPFVGELPITLHTPPRTEYQNLEEIYAQYEKYYREIFAVLKKWKLEDTQRLRIKEPTPWTSAVTEGCIEKGRDRWDGGAKYCEVTVENFAFANTADALGVIEELVFQQKKYTIQELIRAVQNNYVGYEEIHRDVLKCPKYGMNIEKADAKAARILSIAAGVCEENREENRKYLASLHTLDVEVDVGANLPAMLDGRLAGEPVNKNAGPANRVRTAGPTAVAMSACRLDQPRLNGGQALDIYFAVRNLDTLEKRRKTAAFIRTYLLGGGMQMQVNALSSETLEKAYREPQQYQDLIVRIGGHSRYYNDLPDAVKREFIQRIRIEEGAGK